MGYTSTLVFEAGNSPGGSDTGTYTTSAGYVEFNDGRTFGSTVQISGNVLWVSGEVTGTLPSGRTLCRERLRTCASIGSGGTLNVAGGNLTFVGGATLYMKGSAKLLNSGTVNFDSDGGGITAETSAATVVNSSGGVFESTEATPHGLPRRLTMRGLSWAIRVPWCSKRETALGGAIRAPTPQALAMSSSTTDARSAQRCRSAATSCGSAAK